MENKIKNDNVATGVTKKAYGVPYTVLERGPLHSNLKVYVFTDSDLMDKSFVEVEEGLNADRVLFIDDKITEVLHKSFKEDKLILDSLLSNPAVWKSGTMNLNNKTALVQVEAKNFNADFLEELIRVLLQSLKAKTVIILTDIDIKDTNKNIEFKRLQLAFPDLSEIWIKTQAEDFLSEYWKNYFGEPLVQPARTILSKLKLICNGKLTIQSIRGLVERLANTTKEETGVPSEREIQQYFQVSGKRDWKSSLDELVGMDSAKKMLQDLIDQQLFQEKKRKLGIPTQIRPIRLLVSGSPGTGKSTVVKILKDALVENGILHRPPKYVAARNLLSDRVGGTEQLLKEIVETCDMVIVDEIGGLLIDDAFTESIVQQLTFIAEEYPNFHIILVGYPKDMQDFLNLNAGLASRFPNHLVIDDYDADGLAEIAFAMLQSEGYTYDREEIEELIHGFVEQLLLRKNLGNARGVRSLVSVLDQIFASRSRDTAKLNLELDKETLQAAIIMYLDSQPEEEKARPIGF